MVEKYLASFYEKFRESATTKMLEEVQPVLNELCESSVDEAIVMIKDKDYINKDMIYKLYYEIITIGTKCIKAQDAFVSLFCRLFEEFPVEKEYIVQKVRSLMAPPYYGTIRLVQRFENAGKVDFVTDKSLFSRYKNLTKNFFRNADLIEAMNNDDVNQLQSMTSDPDFNIEKEFKINLSDKIERTTIMNYACFVGASKCVKFLWANFHPSLNMVHAISGGNAEIIRFLEQEKMDFNPSDIRFAIEFHRYDVFDWLFDKFFADDDYVTYQKKDLSGIAVRSNWEYGIKCFTSKTVRTYIKCHDRNTVTSVFKEVNDQYMENIEYCKAGDIKNVKAKINSNNVNHMAYAKYFDKYCFISPITVACRYNQLKVVKILIKIPGINIFTYIHDEVGNSMCQAVAGNSMEIIKLLMKLPKGIDELRTSTVLTFCSKTDDVDLLKFVISSNIDMLLDYAGQGELYDSLLKVFESTSMTVSSKSKNKGLFAMKSAEEYLLCGLRSAVENKKLALVKFYINDLKLVPDAGVLVTLNCHYEHDFAIEILKRKVEEMILCEAIFSDILLKAAYENDREVITLLDEVQGLDITEELLHFRNPFQYIYGDYDDRMSGVNSNLMEYLKEKLDPEMFKAVKDLIEL